MAGQLPRPPDAGRQPPYTPPVPGDAGSTNEEWQGNAVSNLISQGVPPDQASVAIQAHLNGQRLSPAMTAITDRAVSSIGPNPQPIQGMRVKAPGTTGATSG